MLLKKIWTDQRGFVATTDLILIASILVLGMIVGLATLRNSVVQEFGDLATALGRLNQSYSYTGNVYDPEDSDAYAQVAGSDYTDEPDFGDDGDPEGQPAAGISVTRPPISEGEPLVSP
jgi:hypothetical protein